MQGSFDSADVHFVNVCCAQDDKDGGGRSGKQPHSLKIGSGPVESQRVFAFGGLMTVHDDAIGKSCPAVFEKP